MGNAPSPLFFLALFLLPLQPLLTSKEGQLRLFSPSSPARDCMKRQLCSDLCLVSKQTYTQGTSKAEDASACLLTSQLQPTRKLVPSHQAAKTGLDQFPSNCTTGFEHSKDNIFDPGTTTFSSLLSSISPWNYNPFFHGLVTY